MPVTTTGGGRAGAPSAPSIPTTDLIHALPYPNGGTFPTWLATVGPNATITGTDLNYDSGTGFVIANPTRPITWSETGPTVNKPFTLVRVFRYAAGWSYYTTNAGQTCYFASFGGDNIYTLSTVAGGFTARPVSASTGYIVERIVRDVSGDMTYTTTGRAPASIGTGRGADLFPFSRVEGNNFIPVLSYFLYSGDNGDLVASGQWGNLAAWIAANNFGASL